MLFGNPVYGTVHAKSWTRPSGNTDFKVSQVFGCTGFYAERPLGSCAHYHRGIDIYNGHCGGSVLAMAAGSIHWAGRTSDGAIVIEINHGGGWFTNYAHLSAEYVTTGQLVSKGQRIGAVGSTGNSTGCHLHFSVKSGCTAPYGSILGDSEGKWTDPWPRMDQNVTVHPKAGTDGIRIRTGGPTGSIFATTSGGRIIRASDGKDLGLATSARDWGGRVVGPGYGGSTSWERMDLDHGYRYLHSMLATRSAS